MLREVQPFQFLFSSASSKLSGSPVAVKLQYLIVPSLGIKGFDIPLCDLVCTRVGTPLRSGASGAEDLVEAGGSAPDPAAACGRASATSVITRISVLLINLSKIIISC